VRSESSLQAQSKTPDSLVFFIEHFILSRGEEERNPKQLRGASCQGRVVQTSALRHQERKKATIDEREVGCKEDGGGTHPR
jgi:hypothetical protein